MKKGIPPQPGQLALFQESLVPVAIAERETAGAPIRSDVAQHDTHALDAAPHTGPELQSGQGSVPDRSGAIPELTASSAPANVPRRRGPRARPRPPQSREPLHGQPQAQAQPRVPPSPHATLDETIPDYLTYLAALGRSRHTLKSFELDLRLLRAHLGNRPVGAIDTGHLRQFIAWVRVSRENTANSLRRKVATIKNFFGYLRDEGYLTFSPADAVPYPEFFQQLPEFLEEEAAARLVAVTEDNIFWRALILLLLDTGLKRDEVLALRVADVHLAPAPSPGSYLVVRETDAAKRLRSRRLPLSDRLRDALIGHYATTTHVGGDSRVLEVSVRGINFIVEVCGQRAGIETSKPRLTPQVLRETFAVAQMRERVREERRRQAEGWKAEQLQLLTLQHDAEVLELLGLKDDPLTARKYRQLVSV